MKDVWEIIIRLRPTIFVAAVAFILLSLPNQMLELYLIDIETIRGALFKEVSGGLPLARMLSETRPILFAMAAGGLAMFVLWLSSVHLVCLDPERASWRRAHEWLAKGLIVVIALAPILGVLFGLNNIRINLALIAPGDVASLKPDVVRYMVASGALLTVGGVVLAIITFVWLDLIGTAGHRMFSHWGVTIGIALILLVMTAIAIWPTPLPWILGTQALVYLFVAALTFLLTYFSHVYQRTGWPVTVMVVAAMFLFSSLGWNDNHEIEYKISEGKPREFGASAIDWLMSRGDRKWYAERHMPYPVYIVATEGGGMYAGYHAASWLGRLQDSCPSFAQHTFAISAVSGGSLGAGVFSALAHLFAKNGDHQDCTGKDTLFAQAAKSFFQNDLLAPLVGAALFPDLLQRVLPVPLKVLDRGRALEDSFAAAWDSSTSSLKSQPNDGEGLFKQPISSFWNPTGASPALFLNATSVASGSRITISPIWFNPTSTAMHIAQAICFNLKSIDLPLATAISLSARFPWLTPAGWLDVNKAKPICPESKEHNRVYLVDGGYFENSGLETAIELATYLRLFTVDRSFASWSGIDLEKLKAEYPYGIEIRIIMIFTVDEYASRYIHSAENRMSSHPGEILPPIQTMLGSREARTQSGHLRAVQEGQLPFLWGVNTRARRYRIADPTEDVWIGIDDIHQVALDGT